MASATESHSMEYETVPASTPEMVRSNSSTYPKKGSSVSPSRKGSKTKENKEKANYRSDQQQTDQHNSPVQHTEMQQHTMLPDQQIPMNIPMGGSPQMTHIQSPRPLHRSRSRQNSEDLDKNGFDKKTRGRVRIRMEFINNKLRRYTTFSKRKTGIMKKAYELSTLTGTQVMLLVASETGHVYTFATPKLQPMITSETGKALIQTCLNSPDPPPPNRNPDERMSQTGYEETELAYPVPNEDGDSKGPNERHMYANSEVSSPTQGFGTINMSHSSFPMNMGFLPSTTKQGDTNNTMAGPGYTVQQQLGPFSNLFPPPTTYANSLPPQNMTNMSHNMTTHMIRLPANMSPSHTIDLGNMVSLNRASNNTSTTVPSTSSDNATTYIYTSSPAVIPSTAQSSMETKTEIKQDSSENETRTNHDSNSSL